MHILVVAATEEEVGRLKAEVRIKSQESRVKNQDLGLKASDLELLIKEEVGSQNQESKTKNQDLGLKILDFELLITGVGMVATAFALGKHLAVNKYDMVINLGIAGSFDRSIGLGEVCEITGDSFSELGAEDGDDFLSIEKLGFGNGTYHSTSQASNFFKASGLRKVTAITVNTVHGNEASIQNIIQRLNPELESMEGAAVFYACKQFNIPCLQIRAVSNYVEKRNRNNWNIGLAIKNLNSFAIEFLNALA